MAGQLGHGRTGQDRTGQDRTGQDRTGACKRMMEAKMVAQLRSSINILLVAMVIHVMLATHQLVTKVYPFHVTDNVHE